MEGHPDRVTSEGDRTILLTLDTNCLVDVIDRSPTRAYVGQVDAVLALAESGVVGLAVTSALDRDWQRDPDDARRSRRYEALAALPVVTGRLGSLFRLGHVS